jgi:uncharacterized repeat protein (TIGR03806 family)
VTSGGRAPAGILVVAVLLAALLVIFLAQGAAADPPFGLEKRIPWTTSRLVGSPEPPLPYTVLKTFTNLEWKAPIYIAPEPGTDRLLVVLAGGEPDRPSKVLRLKDDPATGESELVLEIARRLVYSVCFHPGYQQNGVIFVFMNGITNETERTNRISRFVVDRQPPWRVQPSSEEIVIEWRSAGHDGGDMAFGPDGMLYITTGDGTSDSDGWNSGQTLDDLLGSVLRIDVSSVRAPADPLRYAVPPDNPFVKMPGARPEIWAYGLRNPWRMSIDPVSGQVWVGTNGQDLWETAHLVRRGENYGWSVFEGSHPFYLNRKRGPTPHVPPTIEHHHSEFRSLTGGVVYRGDKLPELNGAYIYGDYSSGRIWGMKHEGERVHWHRELADTSLQIAAFRVDQQGELLIADHGGGIYRLARAPEGQPAPPFPARLSETGLFASVKDHRVVPALIPYSVNAPGWADGADAERFIAVPGESRVAHESDRSWSFPDGTALVQTLSLEREPGSPASRFRVETRVLLLQQGEWAGYSYRWSPEQTDASLVPKEGAEAELTLREAQGAGERRQTWRFPSRTDCMACHSRAASFVLGLSDAQLNRDRDYGLIRDNQLRALDHIGLFTSALSLPAKDPKRLVDPRDGTQDLEARARAYLHVNCSVCHVEAGGGNAKMELGLSTHRERMNLLGARPQHDAFGIANAMLVAPGDPQRSILLRRISHRGSGQMPPLMTMRVDESAVKLMHDWIAQLKPDRAIVREWQMEDLLPALEMVKSGRSLASGQGAFRETGCVQCHRFAGEGGSVGPDLTGISRRQAARDLLESILLPSKVIADEYAAFEVETAGGEIVCGRIEKEDADVLVLRLAPSGEGLVEIKKGSIRRRERSDVSNMPAGVVNVLEKEQILDLLAYLTSDGDPKALPPVTGAPPEKRVAAIVTVYRHNSHADIIVSRLLQTDTLDGKGKDSPLKLASLYTDQKPADDISRMLAASHRFPVFSSVAGALTLGTGQLAVDGVLLVAEHGDYPPSPTGNIQYPKRRLWEEVLKVFRASGRVVPVFVDKHLADNWEDAKFIYDSARELKIPLMAGSSVPGTWRHPAADVARGARIGEIVALTFHTTDAYGFHALEAVQALAEQRHGGETGIRSVQCLGGDAVWKAQEEHRFDPELFDAAWQRLPRHLNGDRPLREAVAKPKLMIVEYEDGLRAFLLELNGAVGEWSAAWRYSEDRRIESTQFWTQEARPGAHFTLLLHGIEQMVLAGKPAWNAERTLMTSGTLDALLQSYTRGGARIETPYLRFGYQPIWRWEDPPPPPPGRPWGEQ